MTALNHDAYGNSYWQPVSFGTVTLMDSGSPIGSSPTAINSAGQASFIATLGIGSHSITAQFNGVNCAYGPSISSPAFVSVVGYPAPVSSVNLAVSPLAPTIGRPVTITATIFSSSAIFPPTGTVQFVDGATLLGTVSVTGGEARLNVALGFGPHNIIARYGGDGAYLAASSAGYGLQVTRLASSLSLTSDTSNTVFGQPITFTAKLAATQAGGEIVAPSGHVQFFAGCLCGLFGMMIDRTLIGTADIANGMATIIVPTLPVGPTQVVATYLGDASWSGATSNAVMQTIAN